jgi:predicted O-methyltransferase YrrM
LNKLFFLKQYVNYCLFAKGKHSIQSPFVFDLYSTIIIDNYNFYFFDKINKIRDKYRLIKDLIHINDLGAGSVFFSKKNRKINEILAHSVMQKKYAELLFKLVYRFKPTSIIELGTSLGFTTCYLAYPNNNSKVYTLEGSKNLVEKAKELFHTLSIENIHSIEGNFDETLPHLINNLNQIDFVLIDGNHTKEATLRYFNLLLPKLTDNSILVFDDINWSKEMNEAWQEIKKNKKVTLTIDLFQLGLVFFRKEQKEKEHFVLKY